MGFISHRVSRNDLEAGDHIYTYRTAFIYSHHGIYVGRDKVVHFTQDQQSSSSNGSSSSSSSNGSSLSSSSSGSNSCFSSSIPSSRATTCLGIPDCDFRKDGSGVIMSCLNCFLGDGSLYRFQYSSSTLAFVIKFRGGVCSTAQSDSPETVVHRAIWRLMPKGPLNGNIPWSRDANNVVEEPRLNL
ncbi:NC domain-containing protein-related [Striga hermonthica]|uniref:NC domain-containing protein-related n=1 Tax=Striga hermonthica TaxID=68872 RepID=A0A9N7RLR7_STRHE|nr:NC domain-containing protein-related [Striga hermonthica]